ncbi:hypothetical protein C922_05594 [Plasmodium inui San Antonio 1]|uniref:Uncharacterized protein n=1 Tax=Plasmodium inui San Antonio 1 TaxID=1237626 RepID=W6ZXL7_9APIC|nr:hypothetical protein C922_05594 [Plasmodium inui San Antonio 1]EUD64028.1 hypothetical protein C922_05594 [Plasmodium inui San Antonio 1]
MVQLSMITLEVMQIVMLLGLPYDNTMRISGLGTIENPDTLHLNHAAENDHIHKGNHTREDIFKMSQKKYIVVENMTHKETSSRRRGRKKNPYRKNDTKQYIQAAARK